MDQLVMGRDEDSTPLLSAYLFGSADWSLRWDLALEIVENGET